MRVVKTLLIAGLMALPSVAFADVYTQDGYPDITIDSAVFTDNTTYLTMGGAVGPYNDVVDPVTQQVVAQVIPGSTYGAAVESIIDVAGTGCDSAACSTDNVTPWPVATVTASGITICDANTTCSASSDIFLQANFLAYTNNGGNGDLEELFTVTSYNQPFWESVESSDVATQTVPAFSIAPGSELLLLAHPGQGTADLTLYYPPTAVTPEPASMTLILGGLAAGYLRKRRAAAKN